jgi:LmbE family N-acetylglucosaminyl deacetylase
MQRGDEMLKRVMLWVVALVLVVAAGRTLAAEEITVQGAPADTGYNVGSEATIRATLKGVEGDPSRFVVFADISYLGTTAVSSAQLDHQTGGAPGEAHFAGGWLIPAEAPTGIYGVILRVEDRAAHKPIVRQKIRGFAAYKKLIRIARTELDQTFYTIGQPIQCEAVLENLGDQEAKNLRVEFSNANYPWISLFSKEGAALSDTQNPELAIKVMKDQLTIPPHREVTIPMMRAGTAAFLQGQQVAVMGAGGPARHEKVPSPEVDSYTVAVWNADRTVLYDMQFTTPAVVRAADRERPTPYSRNFVHPYNSDIDFAKYREFYAPDGISAAIQLDLARTLYRPGDTVRVKATVKNPEAAEWKNAALAVEFKDGAGKTVQSATLASGLRLTSGESQAVDAEAWQIPAQSPPGVYQFRLTLSTPDGRTLGTLKSDIAVNPLPASLMLFNAHEDDEGAYGGLIRAAVEAGIPVRVVFFTSGDVGACERYYSKPCGPNEAREFGMVRMEESADALGHLGVPRENLTFLGLPDGGSGAIWFQHIPVSKPFRSVYLAADHAPYETIYRPNLPYARDAVIEATKQLIADFHPAMIALTHPDERHVDHRTANWFAIKACQELLREKRLDPNTVVLADIAYGAGGYKPAPYKYEKVTVHLSGEAAALKQEMGWLYQSQDGNLAEGMRKNMTELPREERHLRTVDWQEHAGWNE